MLRVWLDGSRGLEQTARKLQRVQQELQDRSKPHKDIRTRMVWRWSVNFDSEGGMYGDWPPLSYWTERDRERHGYPPKGPKLKRTGALRSGFIRQAKDGVVTRDATRWNFQRQPIYLYIQHFGGLTRGRYKARIPSRPIWGLNETDERMARDLMEEYVDSVIAKHF